MAIEALLPSEVARLVYGYLIDEKCFEAAKAFLKESPQLEECRNVISRGRHFTTRVCGHVLLDILENFCSINSIVQEKIDNFENVNVNINRLKHSGDVIAQIKFLLEENEGQEVQNGIKEIAQKSPLHLQQSPSKFKKSQETVSNQNILKQANLNCNKLQNNTKVETVLPDCSNSLNIQKRDVDKSSTNSKENLKINNVPQETVLQSSISVQKAQSKNENVPEENHCEINKDSMFYKNKKELKNSEVQTSDCLPHESKDVAIDTNEDKLKNCVNAEVQTSDIGSPNSEELNDPIELLNDVTFELLNRTEIQEKIASNINKVLEPIKSNLQDVNKAFREARDMTENDPEFLDLLNSIIPPVEEVESTEDEVEIIKNQENIQETNEESDFIVKKNIVEDNVNTMTKNSPSINQNNTVTSTPIKTCNAVNNFDECDWFLTQDLPSPNLGYHKQDIGESLKMNNLFVSKTSESLVTTSTNLLSPITYKETTVVSCSITNTIKDQTLNTPDVIFPPKSFMPKTVSSLIPATNSFTKNKLSTPQKTEEIEELLNLHILQKSNNNIESLSPLLKDISECNKYFNMDSMTLPEIAIESSTSLTSTNISSLIKLQNKSDALEPAPAEPPILNDKPHQLSVIPEEGSEEEPNTASTNLADGVIAKSTPKTLFDTRSRNNRLSMSTPKKPSSHVRALTFDTPPKKSNSDSKRVDRQLSPNTLRRSLKSTCKSSLFQSPPVNGNEAANPQQQIPNNVGSNDVIIIDDDVEEKAGKDSESNKTVKQQDSKNKDSDPTLKKLSKGNWDSDLRKYASLTNDDEIKIEPRRRKPKKPESSTKKSKDSETKGKKNDSSKKLKKDRKTPKKSEKRDKATPRKSKKGDPTPKKMKKSDKSTPGKSKKSSRSKKDDEKKENIEKKALKSEKAKKKSKIDTFKNKEAKETNLKSDTLITKDKQIAALDLTKPKKNIINGTSPLKCDNIKNINAKTEALMNKNIKETSAESQLSKSENVKIDNESEKRARDSLEMLLSNSVDMSEEEDVNKLALEEMKLFGNISDESILKDCSEKKDESIIEKMQVDEKCMTEMFAESNEISPILVTSREIITEKKQASTNSSIDDKKLEEQMSLLTSGQVPKAATPKADVIYDEVSKVEQGRVVQKKYARITTLDKSIADPSDESRQILNGNYIVKDLDVSPSLLSSDDTSTFMNSVPHKSSTPRNIELESCPAKSTIATEVAEVPIKSPTPPRVLRPDNGKNLPIPTSKVIADEDESRVSLSMKPRTPCVLSPGNSVSLTAPVFKVHGNDDSHTIASMMSAPLECPRTPTIILTPFKVEENANLPQPEKNEAAICQSSLDSIKESTKNSDIAQFEVVKEVLLKTEKPKQSESKIENTKNSESKSKISSKQDVCEISKDSESSSSSSSDDSDSSSGSSSSGDDTSDEEDLSQSKKENVSKKVPETPALSDNVEEVSPVKVMPITKTDKQLAETMKETPAKDEDAEVEIHDTPNISKPIEPPTNLNAKFSEMLIQKEREEAAVLQSRGKPKIIKIERILPKVITKPSTPLLKALPPEIQRKAYEMKNEQNKAAKVASKIKIEKSEQEIAQAINSITAVESTKLSSPNTPNKIISKEPSPVNLLDDSSNKRELVNAIKSITKLNNNSDHDDDDDDDEEDYDDDNAEDDIEEEEMEYIDDDDDNSNDRKSVISSDSEGLELVLEDDGNDDDTNDENYEVPSSSSRKSKTPNTSTERTHNTRYQSRLQLQQSLKEDDLADNDINTVEIKMVFDEEQNTKKRRRKAVNEEDLVKAYRYPEERLEVPVQPTKFEILFNEAPKRKKRQPVKPNESDSQAVVEKNKVGRKRKQEPAKQVIIAKRRRKNQFIIH